MINYAEAALLVINTEAASVIDNKRKIDNVFSNVVLKKINNDHNDIVSMIDHAEAGSVDH